MDGWMDGWMDGRTDGWMDGCVYMRMYVGSGVRMYLHAEKSSTCSIGAGLGNQLRRFLRRSPPAHKDRHEPPRGLGFKV